MVNIIVIFLSEDFYLLIPEATKRKTVRLTAGIAEDSRLSRTEAPPPSMRRRKLRGRPEEPEGSKVKEPTASVAITGH